MNLEISQVSLSLIGARSRGTPRIANRLLRRVRDFALVHSGGKAGPEEVTAALDLYEIDHLGLDRLDRAVLEALIVRFAGKPVGLNNLSVALGEEQDTIETVVEPYLLRAGLIARTNRGRQATPAGYQHLGMPFPSSDQDLFD
jgi:Holliday junction DNA helicase RuvB